ncbi:MAG: DUF1934 domain-containing protein [Candidatus Heteroscillospira sp.]|jgi:uncharacterized beta-barrel protein YwiB (DUF1934 family)
MKDVLITILGKQFYANGETDSMELSTDGQYSFGKNGAVFSYMESELTGLEGTKTTFLVRRGGVTMNRTGALTSRMIFEPGENHRFLYETPYGSATMGLETHTIRSELTEHGGELEIEYSTDVEHNLIGKNTFLITIREQKGTV